MKYEIRKFSISQRIEQIIQTNLESRTKTLEQNFKNEEDFNVCRLCELELRNASDKKGEGAKIRSKCEWYQHGEKPTKSYKYNSKALN